MPNRTDTGINPTEFGLRDYAAVSSEIKMLEEILAEIPEENVIERMGFEYRLNTARMILENGLNND